MYKKIRPKEIIRQRNRRLKWTTAIFLMMGLAYAFYWWRFHRDWASTDDAFVTGHLITVKSQTAGTVIEINAENTQYVKQGDVLVRLNGARAKIALEQAEADLGETVRDLLVTKAKVGTLKQRIAARQAALVKARHDLTRYTAAAGEGAVSDQKVQNTQDQILELEAAIGEARAELAGVQAQVEGIAVNKHPTVEKAKNQLRRAFLDYHRRNIVAPLSGYIAKRRAHVGDIIGADMPLLTVIPLDQLWIEANFRETEIDRIRPGQPAEIRVDAYGSEIVYHGVVEGINPGTGSIFALLPPDNATGNFIHIVERVPVRIALDPKELRDNPLRPGLSTLTRINIKAPGASLLDSSAQARGNAYETAVYDHELDGAEEHIRQIVAANMGSFKDE